VKAFFPIYKRELFAFFVTPLAWALILVFLLVQGGHFYLLVLNFSRMPEVVADQSPAQAFFGDTAILYLLLFILIPTMTMRSFAEERRSGTIEPLMTAPVSSGAVVLAKYAAVLTTYVAMWLPTLFYLVILGRTGQIDWNIALSSYLGVFCVGAGYSAVGILISAVTKSQLVAMALTALVILGFFIIGIGDFMTSEGSFLHAACSHLSIWSHMNDFSNGIIDSRRLVFYGTLAVLPLFVTTRVVEAWRWG